MKKITPVKQRCQRHWNRIGLRMRSVQQKERVKRAFIGNISHFQRSKDKIIQNTEQNRGTEGIRVDCE